MHSLKKHILRKTKNMIVNKQSYCSFLIILFLVMGVTPIFALEKSEAQCFTLQDDQISDYNGPFQSLLKQAIPDAAMEQMIDSLEKDSIVLQDFEGFTDTQNISMPDKHHTKNRNTLRQCSICKKYLVDSIHRHMKTVHSKIKKYPCTEQECAKVFKRKDQLTAHINNVHKRIVLYTCRICSKSFRRKDSYDYHLQTYGDKANGCHLCHRHFATENKLEEHSKKHNYGTIIQCQYCNRFLANKYVLKKHYFKVYGKSL